MAKLEKGFFWGVLAGAAAVAIAGAVALSTVFRTSADGGRTWERGAKGKARRGRKK
jgi:hypothetical protein